MIEIGRVKSSEIKKNRDGAQNVVLLQVVLTDPEDVQTVELYGPAGDESRPKKDDLVIVIPLAPAWKIAIAVGGSIVPTMLEGEKKLFSRDASGAIAAFINFLQNGNLQLNGEGDFAVRFTALETAFNELKGKYNDLVTKHNTHKHGGVTPGGGITAGPDLTGSSSAADIAPAKIEEIEVPG